MQFSTNLPSGTRAILDHIKSGVVLSSNVSKAADIAFMQELKRTDRVRFDNLVKNMQKGHFRAQ
jgi:hypothetical protein